MSIYEDTVNEYSLDKSYDSSHSEGKVESKDWGRALILKRPVSYIHITSNIKLFYVLSSRITLHFNYVSLFLLKKKYERFSIVFCPWREKKHNTFKHLLFGGPKAVTEDNITS